MNVIEVKGLSKSFYKNLVLDELDFQVKKGSFTALLGENGSGKSTILNILMGNEALDKGVCSIFGKNLSNNPDELKDKIGHVSEKIRFNYPLPIKLFIKEYAKFFSNFDLEQFFRQANEISLDLDKQFGEYSRGQKMQIVMLASLAQKPELLLIDEVTSVLDAHTRNYFISILKDFTLNGGTVVLTTNIVNEVQHQCTDVIFLSKSKIKFQKSLSDISQGFKKIRVDCTKKEPLPDRCLKVGVNSDGSISYIVTEDGFASLSKMDILEDKRAVTLEDLYIYYSQDGEI